MGHYVALTIFTSVNNENYCNTECPWCEYYTNRCSLFKTGIKCKGRGRIRCKACLDAVHVFDNVVASQCEQKGCKK